MNIHEVIQGEQDIRVGESVPYSLDVSNWPGCPPTAASGTVLRLSDNSAVTPVMMQTASQLTITGNKIYFRVYSASAHERYKVAVQYTTVTGSAQFIPYVFLRGVP